MGGWVEPVEAEAEVDWSKDLNFQQELFVLEYMANGGKAGPAANAAGYAQPYTQGARLLKNVYVAAAIKFKRNEVHQQYHLGQDAILRELAAVAGFNLGDIMTFDAAGNPGIDLQKATREQTKALASIETERVGNGRGVIGTKVKVKTLDKLAALRLLMDHLGMLRQNTVAVQVNLDFGERMAAANARALEGRRDGEG